jgi:hypothetical protein
MCTVRFGVITTLKITMFVFWFVRPWGLLGRYHHFEGTYCLHLQGVWTLFFDRWQEVTEPAGVHPSLCFQTPCQQTGSNVQLSSLGAVAVSVLVTRPKYRGFKPGRGDGFLRATKIRSTPSFGWEVKPEVPCHKIYGMLKIRWRISDTDRQNSHYFDHSSYSTPDVSAGRIARELWWTSQEFSPAGIIISMAVHAHVSPEGWTIGSSVAAVLTHSLTPSTWSMIKVQLKFSRRWRCRMWTYGLQHRVVLCGYRMR